MFSLFALKKTLKIKVGLLLRAKGDRIEASRETHLALMMPEKS
jgi:hypothetical protein